MGNMRKQKCYIACHSRYVRSKALLACCLRVTCQVGMHGVLRWRRFIDPNKGDQ